jgi:flavin reductase (DIM6/NTAB) family NADH-FMN oxidoreductase RutF
MTTKRVELDPIAEALEQMPYGLYIVGSRGEDNINGMMADWVMQVSFNPRLVLVSLENTSTTLKNIRHAQAFTVNLLDSESRQLAVKFCQPRDASKIKGRSEQASHVIYDKFEGVDFWEGEQTGIPILSDAMMWLECLLDSEMPAGDHTLVIGRVVAGEVVDYKKEPLTQRILGWSYAG